MRTIIILLALIILPTVVFAQYVGPSPVVLEFRLYGKDARPITEKEGEYSVTVVDRQGNERVPLEFDENKRLRFWHRPWLEPMHIITIAHQGDTMRVRSGVAIDSLRFSAGNYVVPGGFWDLLNGRFVNRGAIRPRWEDFRVRSILEQPRLRIIGRERYTFTYYFGTIGSAAVQHVVPVPRSSTILAALDPPSKDMAIAMSRDSCRTWQQVHLLRDCDTVLRMGFEGGKRGWAVGAAQNGDLRYAITEDGGASWHDLPELPSWARPDASKRMGSEETMAYVARLDSRRWLMLRSLGDGAGVLLRTRDGGKGWDTLLIGNGAWGGILRFADGRRGMFLGNLYALLTADGGDTWEYVPFEMDHGVYEFIDWSSVTPIRDLIFVGRNAICFHGRSYIAWANIGDR